MERERKKKETRQLISNVATGMFFERGFDAVTLQEIAEAAGVSKMTVLNYFSRKEDLFLDRAGEGTKILEAAIAARTEDESIVGAMHECVGRLAKEDHPFAAINPGRARFWEIIEASASLSARARELADEEVSELTKVLARAAKQKVPDPNARLLAATTLAIWRTAYAESLRVVRAGAYSKTKAHAAFKVVLDRGFRMLYLGMADTPFG